MENVLTDILKSDSKVLKNEPLKNHTTFRTGGNAKYLLLPENEDEIKKLICFLKSENAKYYILGNGSKCFG